MSEDLISKEVEAYCGKCKTDTLHVITAVKNDKIDRVMCKVCTSYHKYKQSSESINKSPIKKTKTELKKKVKRRTRRDKWTRLLDNLDTELAIEYKMDKEYELETPIHHKSFGFGIVKNVIDLQKITVLFQDGEKILVQNLQR